MEENQAPQSSNSSPTKYLIPVAVLAIIVIAAIFFFTQNTNQTQPTTQELTQQPTQAPQMTNEETEAQYANGTFSATGDYVSPGGPRTIDVSITLENGIVTDSTFVGNATDPTSQRFQGEFGENYKEMILGKNIDEISLTKVAGSSLTPQGFTDALEKIKSEARS